MNKTNARRPFTFRDAVTLVAAFAIGFALLRPALIALETKPITVSGNALELLVFIALLHSTPLVFSLSLAVFVIGLRQPRPPLRHLTRWTGFIANAAATLGALFSGFHWLGIRLFTPTPEPLPSSLALLYIGGLPSIVGAFVAGSLLPSALCKRIYPRPVWTDQFAWTLGMLWVAMMLVQWSCYWIIRI